VPEEFNHLPVRFQTLVFGPARWVIYLYVFQF